MFRYLSPAGESFSRTSGHLAAPSSEGAGKAPRSMPRVFVSLVQNVVLPEPKAKEALPKERPFCFRI